MTQPKHTPGPWKVKHDESDGSFTLLMATAIRNRGIYNSVHCIELYEGVWKDESPDDFVEAKANARLIAAAPEMLAAGEKLVEWLDRLAEKSEQAAKTTRFESMREAFTFDAKNFRASAKEMREATQKARGQQ